MQKHFRQTLSSLSILTRTHLAAIARRLPFGVRFEADFTTGLTEVFLSTPVALW